MQLLLKLGVLDGELLIKILLRSIYVQKKIFTLKIEQGLEVLIPKELSQERFPYSFRFYDPIFEIIREHISPEK